MARTGRPKGSRTLLAEQLLRRTVELCADGRPLHMALVSVVNDMDEQIAVRLMAAETLSGIAKAEIFASARQPAQPVAA